MIFTLGPPDLYVLPRDGPGATHPRGEGAEGGVPGAREEVLSAKTSSCSNYVFILTRRALYAYSNGSEFVYLGRVVLAELQLADAESFRDLVILPVPNLIGLAVDNAKRLLILNYQNPNLGEVALSKTPVQTPTNRAGYAESEPAPTPASAASASAHMAVTPASATPVSPGPSAIVNNRLAGAANIGSMLNRIFHPSANEQVDELRDTFDAYLRNFLNFRLVYDVLVPSAFSLTLVLNRQFLFWVEEQAGLYSTIAEEGFLNVLISHFNGPRRRGEEPRRISLYLVTTNLLNNVNIIGNIHLAYGLCYINMHQVLADLSLQSRGPRAYANAEVRAGSNSLFELIHECIRRINNTGPERLAASPPNDEIWELHQQLLSKDNSIDANSILELLEQQGEPPEGGPGPPSGGGGLGDALAINVRSFAAARNYLFMLTCSNVLMYMHVHPQDGALEAHPESAHPPPAHSPHNGDPPRSAEARGAPNRRGQLLGRVVYTGVQSVHVSEAHELLCLLFEDNSLRTLHLGDLGRPVGELALQSPVDDVHWLDTCLVALTRDGSLHFCTYALQPLFSAHVSQGHAMFRQTPSRAPNTFATGSTPAQTPRAGRGRAGSAPSGEPGDEGEPGAEAEPAARGRLLGICNGLRLLVYGDALLVHNLYIRRGGRSPFSLFLSSRNVLVLGHGSFFSPTRSVGSALNSGANKDMHLLKLPSLNSLEEDEEDEGEPPQGIEAIRDIKINNTGNYLLIHHANTGAGAGAAGGIVLYGHNRYAYPSGCTHSVLGADWFTNHIFYTVAARAEAAGVHEGEAGELSPAPEHRGYRVMFYSINNLNELVIEIKLRRRPVCTSVDRPYLFILLDEASQLFCYDLFYIQYSLLYSFNLAELKQYPAAPLESRLGSLELAGQGETADDSPGQSGGSISQSPSAAAPPQTWVEMHVLGYKKFLLLNVYRQLYAASHTHIQHLLDNVGQVISNRTHSESSGSRYEYLVCTADGASYLVYNWGERAGHPSETHEGGSAGSTLVPGDVSDSTPKNTGTAAPSPTHHEGQILGTKLIGMARVNVMSHDGHMLSMANDVVLCLNLARTNLALSYALVPAFLHRGGESGRGPDSPHPPLCSRMFLLENLIYQYNLLQTPEERSRLLGRVGAALRTRLFAVVCRKHNELERITRLEREFALDSEASFDALLAEDEFELASILLLPLQTKTDPYRVRTHFCRRLVQRLLASVLGSSPQAGAKARPSNEAMLALLVKFYNRINVAEGCARDSVDAEAPELPCESLGLPPEGEPGPEPGIDEIVDLAGLKRELLARLNFPAVYRLSFLNTEAARHDLVEDLHFSAHHHLSGDSQLGDDILAVDLQLGGGHRTDDRESAGESTPTLGNTVATDDGNAVGTQGGDGATSSANEEGSDPVDASRVPGNGPTGGPLVPLELNTILYFMLEHNHTNCALLTSAGASSPNVDNARVVGPGTLFCMLVGYANYLGLTELALDRPEVREYLALALSHAREDQAEGGAVGRVALLKRLLLRVRSSYTLI